MRMGIPWNRDEIAVEILRFYARGEPLNYGGARNNQLGQPRAANRHFGSWHEAIEYAGVDYDQIRRYRVWTRDRILDQIRKHHGEGRDLSWRHVSTELDPPLAAAAVRENRFGSWESALEAAGLNY